MAGHSHINLLAKELVLHQLRFSGKSTGGQNLLQSNLNLLHEGTENSVYSNYHWKLAPYILDLEPAT